MKKLAIIGGTGFVGQLIIKEALKRGYSLNVLARNPEKIAQQENVTIIKGDATNQADLDRLTDNVDAVISTLGPSGMNESLKLAKKSAKAMICSRSTALLLPLLKSKNINRIIYMGGASLKTPEDKNNFLMNFLLTKLSPMILGDMCEDRQLEYNQLTKSNVDWTILRCGKILDQSTAKPIKTSATKFQGGNIAAPNIAKFMLDQLDDNKYIKKAVYIAE